ncbi:hypothetical protein BD769DRAFT_1779290 [Suillus cothurnatus]|nr:hypothetical protein BD769DRAFT_1779290 [Suillus cothurnatus]
MHNSMRSATPLVDLQSVSLQLAQKLSELSKRLSHTQGSTGSADPAAADQAATEYRRLTRQWESAVAEIHGLQTFSQFLLPSSYEDLQVAVHQGPVIILIASQYLCSAIIIPTSGDPHHVPLPATVWDKIMLSIVNILENVLLAVSNCSFYGYPSHAAHSYQTKADGSKEPCLEDLYICSYTPTLSALVRSRWMMNERVPPSFVVIGQGQPGAGKGKALLAVNSELEVSQKLVPSTATHTSISGDAVTRAGALKAMEKNTWVHLACHGK